MANKDKDVAAVFGAFENLMVRKVHEESVRAPFAKPLDLEPDAPQGALSAFPTPLSHVHAFGYGARKVEGGYDFDDVVLKTFVFDATAIDFTKDSVPGQYQGVDVQIEYLPIQQALQGVPGQMTRQRPIPGGVSVSPLGVTYVGTLGCFLSQRGTNPKTFALSNNHVFANVNSLAIGTPIVQPGPEYGPTVQGDVFANLYSFIPIQFPTGSTSTPNFFDAALAEVKDESLILTGQIYGLGKYNPGNVVLPATGQRVTKAGRTSGVTSGTVKYPVVNGMQVNYGTNTAQRVAVYNNVISIVGDAGQPFSLPGDSGSLVVTEGSLDPVALLFAGSTESTTCCNLSALCSQLAAWPV